ncbi:MAG: PKD domain-containing protein [Planctomycetota bacterium]|nr:PKD domain-containing protein [Planctomycetota bacterium]
MAPSGIRSLTGLKALRCALGITIFVYCAGLTIVGQEANVSSPAGVSYLWMPAAEKCFFYTLGPDAAEDFGQPRTTQVVYYRFPGDFKGEISLRVSLPEDANASALALLFGDKGAYTDPNGHRVYPDSHHGGALLGSTALTGIGKSWSSFGPFKARDGELVGGWAYFKVVVRSVKGGEIQRFRVGAAPARRAESFCFNASLAFEGSDSKAQLFLDAPQEKGAFYGITTGNLGDDLQLASKQMKLRLKAPVQDRWIRYSISDFDRAENERCRLETGSESDSRVIVSFTDQTGQPLKLHSGPGKDAEVMEPPPAGPEPGKPTIPDLAPTAEVDNGKPVVVATKAAGARTATNTTNRSKRKAAAHFTRIRSTRGTIEEPRQKAVAKVVRKKRAAVEVNQKKQDAGKAVQQERDVARAGQQNLAAASAGRPVKPNSYLTFHLDASDNFDPNNSKLSFLWEFGDGIRGRGIRTVHTYSKPGEYKVTLTVKNRFKVWKKPVVYAHKVIANLPPRPLMRAPERCTLGEAIRLDASGSTDTPGDSLTFLWDFGDGHQGKGDQVTHAYRSAGEYTVKLTALDDKETFCSRASISRTVHVEKLAPVPLLGAGKVPDVSVQNPLLQNAGIPNE